MPRRFGASAKASPWLVLNSELCISCISGASRGGLSSYACNVLVIHYLQNTEPPVIPVLQQLGQQEPKLVDGCNVYFFNNIDELESVWSGKRHNLQQVGELWVGLLRYYADFDIKKYVVSIRAKTPVTRLQKRWESEFMAIEDPFDIERDLGQHVTKNKGEFIISALKKGMMRCEKPIPQPAGQYVTLVAYFFDAKTFEEGSPPQGRHRFGSCHICGMMGHYIRNCPHMDNIFIVKKKSSANPSIIRASGGFTVKHATQPPRRSIS
nr:terminal uridylyltransferase 7-like [Rhipicephalus microplus]